MEYSLVYVTTKDQTEAKKIATALLDKKLIACANITAESLSLYEWKGAREETTEAMMFMKTTREKVPDVIEEVKKLHSYDCPCVVSIPIEAGNREYLEWLTAQTSS